MNDDDKTRILIAEDDPDIGKLIEMHLRDDGYEVTWTTDSNKALELALENNFELIILDLMLPGIGGLEVCKNLRMQQNFTLVLMLTAKSSEIDRVLGLELGADDYMTKPFSLLELKARVKALLRRKAQLQTAISEVTTKLIEVGDLSIDLEKREVRIQNKVISLTSKEFDLLVQFAQHPGKVYSRSDLLDLVWGYGYDGFEHTVNSHINRLRAKIEQDPNAPQYVQTVWGVGYKFVS